MQEQIEKIRALLSELEKEVQPGAVAEAMRVFSGLELPDIVRDIVDLLMPVSIRMRLLFIGFFSGIP